MLITTVISNIDQDISWRKKEIWDLFNFIKYCSNPTSWSFSYKSIYYRSYILLIYAHLEWTLKYVGANYLEFISSKDLKFSELNDWFFETYVYKSIKWNEKTVYGFLETINNKSKIYYQKKEIPTESNVKFKVFEKILNYLSIDYNDFEKVLIEKINEKINEPFWINYDILNFLHHNSWFKYNFQSETEILDLNMILINSDYKKTIKEFLDILLWIRNAIAHWENTCPPFDKLKPLWEFVLIIIDSFKDCILDYLVWEKYKKTI